MLLNRILTITSVCFFVRSTLSATWSTSSAFVIHPTLQLGKFITLHVSSTENGQPIIPGVYCQVLHLIRNQVGKACRGVTEPTRWPLFRQF
jgi:hypothetical protein